MDDNSLPTDITECHKLLLAAFKQSVDLEQKVAQAQQQATQAKERLARTEQQVTELNRVLDETA